MKNRTIIVKASFIALILMGSFFLTQGSPVRTMTSNASSPMGEGSQYDYLVIDRFYDVDPEVHLYTDDLDDAGYRRDAGNSFHAASLVYPGEMIDNTPGRARTGKLSPTDLEDWYSFSICQGQDISVIVTPPAGFDFDLDLWDIDNIERAVSSTPGDATEIITFTTDKTGPWRFRITFISGPGQGQYTFDVNILTQNDADTGADAGNDFAMATPITPGTYFGYLDMNDEEDWYKFDVTSGQGINLELTVRNIAALSDYDISLYNPLGVLVYEATEYYNDKLLYPADMSGQWRVRIHIFPGYTNIPQPTEWYYYTYGSGAYQLKLALDASAPAPPTPGLQPDITPIAKTYIVDNVPNSYTDEYGFLAAIPASNHLRNGKRYLAPIIYTGDQTPTAYFDDPTAFGVVDDTTQYFIDDWNAYLASHGKTPMQYIIPANPVTAAAEIATQNWESSPLAVVAIDGSVYEDEEKQVLKRSKTLRRVVNVEEIPSDSAKIKEFGYSMLLGPKWGAINLSLIGSHTVEPSLNQIFPKFNFFANDHWPSYSGEDKIDIYYPVTTMGLWSASANEYTGSWHFRIAKLAGDRYRIRVNSQDTTLKVTVTTDTPNDLLVFLIDPQGHLRAPDVPYWWGPVNPIHEWNGFSGMGFDPWRTWTPEPATEFSAEVLHPEKGLWTAIVVPRYETGPASNPYTITGVKKTLNTKGSNAAISAANAAVIASQLHVPLLYVTEDSVPAVTASAFTTLGVDKVIFVHRDNIGSAVKSDLPAIETELITMQQIIDFIKDFDSSQNYITVTSLKSSDGFFAPAAMLAAYYGSPVLRIEEAPGNPAGIADRIETWRLWAGDYYHGARSLASLPKADEPIQKNLQLVINMLRYFLSGGTNGSIPPLGVDANRYWHEDLHDTFHKWIDGYGLDREGQEGYCFVAPRKDIYIPFMKVLCGNNSYAGQIPGDTPAWSAALVARNILYPAVIFANPNRDITTSKLINFPDVTGGYNMWRTNDGTLHSGIASSHKVKHAFSSHFRNYQGHCLWAAHLERMNEGASVMYYTGHGTGGSGTSAMFMQSDKCNYPDQIWWDSWRSYMFDNWRMPRDDGFRWFNSKPPHLYDFIHYKWVDQLLENLRSNAVLYMSCTTGSSDGPMVYLDHGAVMWYGNAASGLCPPDDLRDDMFLARMLIDGDAVGPAVTKDLWLFCRDYTSGDENVMYGPSSMSMYTYVVVYGDPNLIIYAPSWTSPVPVDA